MKSGLCYVARQEGASAYLDKKTMNDCPYDADDLLGSAWADGWEAAKKAATL